MKTARISKSVCPVKAEPSGQSESTSEVLFGEVVLLQESTGGWCKIKTQSDGYEGFVEEAAFDITDAVTTHWVSTRSTLVFERADIKSVVLMRVHFGSELVVNELCSENKFLQLKGGGYVWAQHCLNKGSALLSSMIEIGRQHYLNAPYLWGGRSTSGCDCSGLVQMLASARGIDIPRDSIDQQADLHGEIEFSDRQAEDLVFWPGHVGVLKSPETLLHATAHSMRCCFEPLQQVIERAGKPVAIKRLA